MDQQPEQTQQSFQPSEEPLQTVEIVLSNPLVDELMATRHKYGHEIADKIQSIMKYRQDRSYQLIANDKVDYFSSMWQYMQKQLAKESPNFENQLLQHISDRQGNIINDILQNRLVVETHRLKPYDYEQEQKLKKMSMLRDQSTEIQKKLLDMNEGINQIKGGQPTSESRFKAFQINQTKLKQYEEFVKKQKKDKEERMKQADEQRKKDQKLKAKKEEEEKELKDKLIKERKEELLKKVKQSQEKREKEKQDREQRDKQYKYIAKSTAQQPPLFKKLQQNYHNRYQKLQSEKRRRAISERHSMFTNIDEKGLQQHEKKYEQLKAEKQRQRRDRQQEHERMMEMQEEEVQTKYKSSYDLKSTYVDHKEEERKAGLEKKQKVKRYIQETVKERYLPRIDEEKRREFMKLIQDLDKKKVKKVKKEDGSYEYEQVKPGDARMIGLEYLQKTKQMANKMRGKRKNSDSVPDIENDKPRVYDYLAEKRKKGTSMSHRDRLDFVNKKGLSYEQKAKKVQLQSQKLQQLAKQKQMKLKFGKFSTSDQILQHKQQIDQHYIDIINMKLKLINFKQE